METIKVKVVLPGGEVKTGKIDLAYSPERIEAAILECFGLDKEKFVIRNIPKKEHFYDTVLVIDSVDFVC